MALSVIGAGLGRTGTFSIKLALEQLGLGPCHHMDDVFASPKRLRVWQTVAAGDATDWSEVFAGYGATIDWPGTNYWRELAEAFPQAKVLLSVRPAEPWWRSFDSTIRRLIESRHDVADRHLSSVLDFANLIINERMFGGAMASKSAAIEVYERRTAEVKATIPPNRLLVFDIQKGWPPLCDFLKLPVPDCEFPRTNDAGEFWQHFGAGEQRS